MTRRQVGTVTLAAAALLGPLAALGPVGPAVGPGPAGPGPAVGQQLAVGPRPAVDAVAEEDTEQTCTQDGGYATSRWPTALTDYDAGRVWAHATGRGVRVAVVDSGLDLDNPHFTSEDGADRAYAEGTSMLPASLAEEFLNAYDERGWVDPSGHGTAVAGVLGARPVEGSGVVGLAPHVTIVPVQVFGAVADPNDQYAQLLPDTRRLAEGIRWAADADVQVIAVSMSVPEPHPELAEAVAYALERDVLVVASAGSSVTATDDQVAEQYYPAGFPGVIGVTALDRQGNASELNFTGPHVDIAAPGQHVATAFRGLLDCYLGEQPAPSYAVPYVAATAALLAERYPDEGPQLWTHRLLMSAQRPAQASRDDTIGWGALSPYDALTMTIDAGRSGPAVPGWPAATSQDTDTAPGVALPPRDPWQPARDASTGLVAGGAVAVALVALGTSLSRRRSAGAGSGRDGGTGDDDAGNGGGTTTGTATAGSRRAHVR